MRLGTDRRRFGLMTGVYDEAELYCGAFDFCVEAEINWLLQQVPHVQRILEPMCGNARYGRAFAARGIEYVGLDRSRAMLARAEVLSGMTLLEADARDFAIDGDPFDLACCPIDSIRHLSGDGEIARHLACIHRHLRPGGHNVIEVELMRRDGENPLPPDTKSHWTIDQPDGTVIEASVRGERFDLARRLMWERSIYRRLRDGVIIAEVDELHEMRQITWDDLATLVAAAGFEIAAIHAHLSGNRRPRVEPGPHLENRAVNHYIFLRAGEP
jgi:SAM-dependent methyltransferase